jgi:hypothetical protein
MRRTNATTDRWRWGLDLRRVGAVCAGLAILFGAASASAVSASFDSTGTGFVESTALLGLPTASIDLSTPLLSAGDTATGFSFDVDFTGSAGGQVCILAASSPGACQSDLVGVTGAYSALVTLDISAINSGLITGPFTLAISQLQLMSPGGDVFSPSEVSIALDPTAPMGLDTSAVDPGFVFDGTFTPFVRIEDSACMNSAGTCSYLGWTIDAPGGDPVGQTVTFRFDVSTAPAGRDTPQLLFNAVPVVVPEPGTALLVGLGLLGLATHGRAARRRQRGG